MEEEKCKNCDGFGYNWENDPTYITEPNEELKVDCEVCSKKEIN